MSSVRLVIFDMDDTLVASADTWGQAERRLFRLLGREFDPAIAQLYKGCNARDVGRVIFEQLRPAGYTADDCGQLIREFLFSAFQGHLRMMPGADVLLSRLAGRYSMAIASGSPLDVIQLVLERFTWQQYFDLLISSESVVWGKPAPDVFVEAATRYGCRPCEALVIEDSLYGVHAAKSAGMSCFVVPSSDDPHIIAAADRAFASLADITLDDIEAVQSVC
ncbi:MAG TPA: HAD family phosphatase [Armatimonadota bacterium]|nr:HAD family phosphatase [Armatimonadota bacterium]